MTIFTSSILSTFTGATENPISEGGNWHTNAADGFGALGGALSTGSGLSRSSGSAMGNPGNSYWHAQQFGPYVEAFVTLLLGGSTLGAVEVAIGTGLGAGWSMYLELQSDGTVNLMRVYRNGSGANLTLPITKFVSGDKVGLRIYDSPLQGSTGEAWVIPAATGLPIRCGAFNDKTALCPALSWVGLGLSSSNRADDFGAGAISAPSPLTINSDFHTAGGVAYSGARQSPLGGLVFADRNWQFPASARPTRTAGFVVGGVGIGYAPGSGVTQDAAGWISVG